jgi:hypothetical protein
MPQLNLLELAKQGNVKAIAALMNRSLQPKGITVVKATLKDSCLELLLESAQVPNQQTLAAFVRQRIIRLRAALIEQVKLYVRQTGEEIPAWSQELELAAQPLPVVISQPSPLELAKQGNVEAIAALMNRSLQPKGITVVKAAFKDSCLQILLESAQVPNQQALVALIRKQVKGLNSASIKQVKLYGRKTGEEIPAWSQELELAGQLLPVVKPPPSLLELAKQGNVEALTALMNRSLQPKGIAVVKAIFKDSYLQILLESAQVPNQQALVAFVDQGLTRLEAASIKQVKLYGRQIGEEFPAWSQEFELAGQPLPVVISQPNLLELAKQGNVEAIAALMNRSLQPKGITVVKAAFKDSCLHILLESAQVPDQQALVAFVDQGLTRLEAASIKQVKLYGRQTGEEFPAWSQEFEKDSNGSLYPNNTTLPTTNYADNKSSGENISAKPFVSHAHQKFWQLPSLARFGVIGIILLVVSLNIFIIFNSHQLANLNAENLSSSNPDEQYKYILNDFIKDQLKNDEDIMKSMELFKKQGGFEVSKQRALKNCKALSEGVVKEKLLQGKTNEVMNALNYSKTDRALTDKEMQQMNYLFAIYSAEVFAGQDVYCPETRKDFQINN